MSLSLWQTTAIQMPWPNCDASWTLTHPSGRQIGDVGNQVETALIVAIARGNALVREATQRQLDEMKRELVAPNAPILERLAAERVLICWLELQLTDVNYAEAPNEFILKRKQVAQNRFHRAIKNLDLVRQLKPRRRSAASPASYSRKNSNAKPQPVGANRIGVFFGDEMPVGGE